MRLQYRLILSILGLILFGSGATLLPSMLVAAITGEQVLPWVWSLLAVSLPGAALWFANRNVEGTLKTRDGFLITVLVWVTLCAAAATVFSLTMGHRIDLVDLVFEAVSGFTTTGATVLVGLDDLPKSFLLYRQMLQWMGGMGLLVLATAILPALEVGGMQLRRELQHTFTDITLPARFRKLAQWLLVMYLSLTVLCTIAYWLAGMSAFDALAHSFTTVSIGGFSTHDASIGYFQNSAIENVCMLFMILSTINFALHFKVFRVRNLMHYLHDTEMRAYLRWVAVVLTAFVVLIGINYDFNSGTVRQALFQAISFMTTTGFVSTDFGHWPTYAVLMLVAIACVGGCSGSMAGGLKIFRLLIFVRQARQEIVRLIHPNAVMKLKMGTTTIAPRALESLWGFLTLWIMSFLVIFVLLMVLGVEPFTAMSAVAACLTNLGPGQGEVASNYSSLSANAKMLLAFAMLLGRLEIFTLLVLFSPSFWKH